jgi:hypothetical protein
VQRQLLDAHFRENGLVAKDPSGHVAIGENLRLQLKETARGIAQVDNGKPVLDRDVQRPYDLLGRQRIPGAAFHRGIVGTDDHLAPRDDSDTHDCARRRRLAAIGHIGRERGQFEEWRPRIEQLLDALARAHLALLREAIEIALRTPVACFLLSVAERFRQSAVVSLICAESRAGDADHGRDLAHRSVRNRQGFEFGDNLVLVECVSNAPQESRETTVARSQQRHLQLHAFDRN